MRYRPMLLSTAEGGLPEGESWIYEGKWDGYRIVADTAGETPLLQTRTGNDLAHRYVDVVDQLPAAVAGLPVVLDGEMLAFDDRGREDYYALRSNRPRVTYYIFDLLEMNGSSLTSVPLRERRYLLGQLFEPQPAIALTKMYSDKSETLEGAKKTGLEGVIAKKLDSVYRPGKRSKDWQKQILVSPATRRKISKRP